MIQQISAAVPQAAPIPDTLADSGTAQAENFAQLMQSAVQKMKTGQGGGKASGKSSGEQQQDRQTEPTDTAQTQLTGTPQADASALSAAAAQQAQANPSTAMQAAQPVQTANNVSVPTVPSADESGNPAVSSPSAQSDFSAGQSGSPQAGEARNPASAPGTFLEAQAKAELNSGSSTPQAVSADSPQVADASPVPAGQAVSPAPPQKQTDAKESVPAAAQTENSAAQQTQNFPADSASQIPQQSSAVISSPQSDAPAPQDAGNLQQTGTVVQPTNRKTEKDKDTSSQDDTGQTAGSLSTFSDIFGNGKVTIKVFDSTAKQSSSASAAGQLADAVSQQAAQGRQQFQVDLYPQSLGKVSVKLTTQNGLLTVEISAQNPKTQSMLVSGSGEIKSMLQSSMGQQVQVTQPGQASQWYAQQGGGGSGGESREDDGQKKKRQSVSKTEAVGIDTGSFLTMMSLMQTGSVQTTGKG